MSCKVMFVFNNVLLHLSNRLVNDAGSPSLAKTYRDGPHPDNARIEALLVQS